MPTSGFDIFAPFEMPPRETWVGSSPIPSADLEEYYDALERIAEAQADAEANSYKIYVY